MVRACDGTHALASTSAATSPPTQTFRHPGRVLGKMVMRTRFRSEEMSAMMMFSVAAIEASQRNELMGRL